MVKEEGKGSKEKREGGDEAGEDKKEQEGKGGILTSLC